MKYAFIAQQQSDLPVRLKCRLLDVSASGFYASMKRGPSGRSRANERLKLEIRAVHEMSRRRYGALKVHAELKAQGTHCGHNRIARLMQEDGLRSKRPRAFRVTTQSRHRRDVAENELARSFDPGPRADERRVWVSDITYLATREGWLYLAIVLDLASRRIVGWCTSARLDEALTLGALNVALKRRGMGEILHHSDRGVQYASEAYQSALKANGIRCSMSRKADCWDNAVAESFFATLKTELVIGARWESRSQGRRDLAEYIELWYNCRRRHATLGYRTPAEYEIQMLKNSTAA